jgi:hypothetical protein
MTSADLERMHEYLVEGIDFISDENLQIGDGALHDAP